MKLVARGLALILLSAVLGTALLVGAYALPTEPMRKNVAASAEIFSYESGYPRLIEGWHVTMLDNFTDTVMLLTAVSERKTDGILRQVADAPRAVYEGGSWLINHIDAYANDGMPKDVPQAVYPRYWHGYLAVLKPLLLVFDYAQIRLFNMIVQSFLLLAVLFAMWKRLGAQYAVALTAALICITPFAIPLSMQFSTCAYILLVALLLILKYADRLRTPASAALFFCAVGVATNYFDFLTYPLITLGIPLSVLLLTRRDDTVKSSLATTLLCCVFWGAGYALMWASKWGMATLVTGNNIFADAFGSIGERTSLVGGGELGAGAITRMGTIRALVGLLKRRPYLIMAAGLMVALVWRVVTKRASIGKTPLSAHAPSLALVALMPFVWYAVMPNHSYTHYFYTFRALAVTVFAGVLLPLLFVNMQLQPPTHGDQEPPA